MLRAKAKSMKQADPDAPPPEEGAEAEDLVPAEVEGDLGDLLKDMGLLERAGVGFGREENFRLFLALKELLYRQPGLAEGEKIAGVKLWGKVIGTRADPPPPPPRTKWTRRVPHPVLIGHAASLTQGDWHARGLRDCRVRGGGPRPNPPAA